MKMKIKKDAGDVEYNISRFNNSTMNPNVECSNDIGMSMGESFNDFTSNDLFSYIDKVKTCWDELRGAISMLETYLEEQSITDVSEFIHVDLINVEYEMNTLFDDMQDCLDKIHDDEIVECKVNYSLSNKHDLPEDFDVNNLLNDTYSPEYGANVKRKKHIDMYRKFAFLDEDVEITEDNVDELALQKTAVFANREYDRIKSEILGQTYSDYEL